MLSTAAWNAFLKTLEEPPPNTVFVLATTEAGKVPATVVDRCHRFDFQRPTVEQIAQVVRRTAEAESIEIPPEAIAALARSATGSFRDALGTLEQLRHLQRQRRSRSRTCSRCSASPTRALLERDGRRGRRRRRARGAARARGVRRRRARRRLVRRRPRGARARAAGRADARRGPVRALAHARGRRARCSPRRSACPHAAVVRLLELLGEAMEAVRAGADARTRLELALVQGGPTRGRRLDAGAAGPDRAAGGRARGADRRRRRRPRLRPRPRRDAQSPTRSRRARPATAALRAPTARAPDPGSRRSRRRRAPAEAPAATSLIGRCGRRWSSWCEAEQRDARRGDRRRDARWTLAGEDLTSRSPSSARS